METGVIQISILIYCMANEAENVLKTVTFPKKEDKNFFEIVMIKFEDHFMLKNTTYEKVMFHFRAQRLGQCDTFVRA